MSCIARAKRIADLAHSFGSSAAGWVALGARRPLRMLAVVFALAPASGCDSGPASSPAGPASRVLIIGIDGASDRVIGPMMRAGRLPNLSRIARDGVYGPIRSTPLPLLSPRIWTTVATGKTAMRHQIHGWTRATGKEGVARLNYSYDRKSHALWNILSSRGKTVGIVNWLTTYPPEIVRGVMVSSHTFPVEVQGRVFLGKIFARATGNRLEPVKRGNARGAVVFPPDWTPRVLDESHIHTTLTRVGNPFLAEDAISTQMFPREAMAQFYEIDQRLVSVTLEIQREQRPDLVMLLLQGIDRICHGIWAGIEDPPALHPDPRHDPDPPT